MSMNKYVLWGVVVAVLGIGTYYVIGFSDNFNNMTVLKEEKRTMNNVQSDIIINKDESVIAWSAKKIIGSGHEGTVQIKEAVVDLEGTEIRSATLLIDMNSIKDVDNNEMLINHLKSEDFFAVATYPEARFDFKRFEADAVIGTLTIKGISNEIKMPGSIKNVDGQFVLESEFSIDRTLWDIRYGSGKFFENLGDKTINDEIQLKVKLVGKKT